MDHSVYYEYRRDIGVRRGWCSRKGRVYKVRIKTPLPRRRLSAFIIGKNNFCKSTRAFSSAVIIERDLILTAALSCGI